MKRHYKSAVMGRSGTNHVLLFKQIDGQIANTPAGLALEAFEFIDEPADHGRCGQPAADYGKSVAHGVAELFTGLSMHRGHNDPRIRCSIAHKKGATMLPCHHI